MSIVGTSYRDPEQWDGKKKEIIKVQDSIEVQERTIESTKLTINEIKQIEIRMAETLRVQREVVVQRTQNLSANIANLDLRMDDLLEVQTKLVASNDNIANVINSIINSKIEAGKTATDLYVEAKCQFLLMTYNADYKKFASAELEALEAGIKSGEMFDWTNTSMFTQAKKLLSDLYMTGIKVIEEKKMYEQLQFECIKLATEIQEKAEELRKKAKIDHYSVGKNIDFWCSDDVRNIQEEVQEILVRISSMREDPSFTTEDLKIIKSKLDSLDKKKDDAFDRALDNILHSEQIQSEVNFAGNILLNKHAFRLVGSGYELGDMRRPFIARFRRDADDIEVELIGEYDQETGRINIIHRVNSSAYNDPNVIMTIEQGIAEPLNETGEVIVTSTSSCGAEDIEEFDQESPTISEQTKNLHGFSGTPLR